MKKKIELTRAARFRLLQDLKQRKMGKARARRSEPPWRRGTVIYALWERALKGTSVAALQRYCADVGADWRTPMRILRSGFCKGFEWEVLEEGGGKFQVTPC